MIDFDYLMEKVLEWAEKKDLLHDENARKQFLKFIEEVFEFKTEMDTLTRYRDYYKENPHKKIPEKEHARITKNAMLEMGDVFVTLIILCDQLNMNPTLCLSMAYEKIKKRKGVTKDGIFIKEEDL